MKYNEIHDPLYCEHIRENCVLQIYLFQLKGAEREGEQEVITLQA